MWIFSKHGGGGDGGFVQLLSSSIKAQKWQTHRPARQPNKNQNNNNEIKNIKKIEIQPSRADHNKANCFFLTHILN